MKASLIVCCLLGLTTAAYCADKTANTYQKGSIAIIPSSKNATCKLQTQEGAYQISKCQDLHDGEAVEYRVQEQTVFIRTSDAKELKRRIEATELKSDPNYKPIVWLKGTIQGYSVQKEFSAYHGAQSGFSAVFGKKVKVYELHGAEADYLIDHCGSFQAGTFAPGQEVEYRLDGERLNIRHDGNQEYACQIEGRGLPNAPKPPDGAKPGTTSGSTQQN